MIEDSYVVTENPVRSTTPGLAPYQSAHLSIQALAWAEESDSIRLWVELVENHCGAHPAIDGAARIVGELSLAESKGLRKALKRAEKRAVERNAQ